MTDSPKFDPRQSVYTPTQVATYGLRAAEETRELAKDSVGIHIPIHELGDYVTPVLPGQLMAIIAQTSNYKSGFIHYLEDANAKRLTDAGMDDHIIIHVSVEESIEEQAYLGLSTKSGISVDDIAQGSVQDWSLLEKASATIGSIPIYRIGESLARSDDMPNLYISNMIKAIDVIVNGDLLSWKPKVAGIFFDYLQAFPLDPQYKNMESSSKRRLQVRSDIYRLRQCAAKYRCPIIVAVQAKQTLQGAKPPILLPGIYDGEESSSIAQRSDRVLTLWMPKQANRVGDTVRYGQDMSFVVQENQLWIRVAKQRGRLPAGNVFPCLIDYSTNDIRLELEPRSAKDDKKPY
jgi:hypothetical protein